LKKYYPVDEFVFNCILPFTMQKTDVLLDALVNAIKNVGLHITETEFYINHPNLGIYLSTFRKVLASYIIASENGYIPADEHDFRIIRNKITDQITQHIMDITDDLSLDFISALGAERYEKGEAKGLSLSILPSRKTIDKCTDALVFKEPNRLELTLENVHSIRKQLNLSNGGALAVTWNYSKAQFETIGVISEGDAIRFPWFEFCGSAEWKFCLPPININEDSTPQTPANDETKDAPNQIDSACRVYVKQGVLVLPPIQLCSEVEAYIRKKNLLKSDFEYDTISHLVEATSKCEHGALLVFTSRYTARKESLRLAHRNSRGMQTKEPIPFSDRNKLKKEFYQLTSIDGALILDFDGNCYAYGVILDGVARGKGNSGRGARYNSAVTYIKNKSSSKLRRKMFAVVCSEDGMVDVIC